MAAEAGRRLGMSPVAFVGLAVAGGCCRRRQDRLQQQP
uniref:Uncharacterized protein n=1 Tax=Arundo donax TaxID=35708 RepID=A0A0A9FHN6_ARUDO